MPFKRLLNVHRARIVSAFFLTLFLCLQTSLAHANSLPEAFQKALKEAQIPEESVAVFVQKVSDPAPFIVVNGNKAMNPASVMKVVTTYAALEILGASYTWKTEIFTDAPMNIINGKLQGNLYVKGSGDPSLNVEELTKIIRDLRDLGIREIDGNLVFDRSAFLLAPHNPAAFDNDPQRPYNVGANALLMNLQSQSFLLKASADNKSVDIIAKTPMHGVKINNQLSLTKGACGDFRDKIKVSVSTQQSAKGEKIIDFKGGFASNCQEKMLHLSLFDANTQTEILWRALWLEINGQEVNRQESNGKTAQAFAKIIEGFVPPNAYLLATHQSKPLPEVIRLLNKFSNNVMARQTFLSLAEVKPASEEEAQQRVKTWLIGKKIDVAEWALENGSGLSRTERVTAYGLGQLLLSAWQSPVMPELLSSLPISGVDGTLKKRLNKGAARGQAHLKTGYLANVRSIAGVLLTQQGERFVVVVLINDARASYAQIAIDTLLEELVEQ